ncbi:MAG: hypothetical protein A2Y36_08100 [Treponema sp. GWA1_62_8]|nr:MAG: hypothetical protein A2Y36_08100 [Treponema sp. GWA1_62_8]
MMGGIAGGVGASMAGMMSNSISPAMQQMPPTQAPQQPPQSQAPQPVDEMAALKQKIEKLKMMKDSGLISDDEWEAERKKLLSNL